jgi:hypothetical protein
MKIIIWKPYEILLERAGCKNVNDARCKKAECSPSLHHKGIEGKYI